MLCKTPGCQVSEIGTVPGISRVLYGLTPKRPGTTEWERGREGEELHKFLSIVIDFPNTSTPFMF